MFRFVHAADIHLDSPLRGLEAYEGAPAADIRGATRRALEDLVRLCLDEEAAFLLIAGDLYDGDWEDYGTGLFFADQMVRLRDAGIPVFIVNGNHDAASAVTKRLTLPDNVTVFTAAAPETAALAELGVAVHGQSFATAAVTDNLAAGYPAARPGLLNIGLLHTALSGRAGHDPYAPCTETELLDKGYDYWALGHVHGREIVRREPWIVFPGNLQGRHIRETGPKGAMLVGVEGGRITGAEFRELGVMRWEQLEVDAADAATVEAVEDRVRQALDAAARPGRLLAVRLRVTGACPAHGRLLSHRREFQENLRNLGNQCGRGRVWIEKVRLETTGKRRLDELLAGDDAEALLARLVKDLEEDPDGLRDEFTALADKLPRELDLDFADAGFYRAALEDARDLLLDRLQAAGEDA